MGQIGNQRTEPMGLWGRPTPLPPSPASSLPPPPTCGDGWRSGLEPLSYTFCCVCDVGSACDRVLPFCLAVSLLPPLQTPTLALALALALVLALALALRYCLKTPSQRKNKYD